MRVSTLQAVISIMVLSTFLIVTGIIALTPVVGGYPTEPYTEHLRSFAALYSGIVGLILGYYFGKGQPK